MRIEVVKPHEIPVLVFCLHCGGKMRIEEGGPAVFADLDGPVFKAYYHNGCRPDNFDKTEKPNDHPNQS